MVKNEQKGLVIMDWKIGDHAYSADRELFGVVTAIAESDTITVEIEGGVKINDNAKQWERVDTSRIVSSIAEIVAKQVKSQQKEYFELLAFARERPNVVATVARHMAIFSMADQLKLLRVNKYLTELHIEYAEKYDIDISHCCKTE